MKNIWLSVVRAPYRGLPWIVWLYVLLCALIQHQGGVFSGHIFGFDDHVRMVQVLNWVNGASWYDRTITRTNLPEGFTSIWSRIVDIPLASIVLIAQQFMVQKQAALVAAFIMPLVELAILFKAAPYFVRPLVGKKHARLIILFLLFTSLLNFQFFSISGFIVGEASHHPWYVILYLLMFGAVARLALGSASNAPILMFATSVALITTVGIEGYPMIAGAAALLALVGWGFNRPLVSSRGSEALFYAGLGSFLLMPMHQPPENWFTVSFAEPSILGGILILTASAFLKIEALFLEKWCQKKILSAAGLVLVALVICAALVAAFPRILDGAAAALSPEERAMALREHYEARSVYAVSRSLGEFINLVMPCVIALTVGSIAVYHSKGRRRALHICYLGFAVLGTSMSSLFSRYYHHAMTTACAWLLYLWQWTKQKLPKDMNYSLAALGTFVIIGPLWMLLLPAIEANEPIVSHVLLFPSVMQTVVDPCDSLPLSEYLNAHYSKDTMLMDPYWLSAQLLYQTDMRIEFIANYPSQNKFIDNYTFFLTTRPDTAKEIALRHQIDLVTVCTKNPAVADRDPTGKAFIQLLEMGLVPSWLKPVPLPIETNYVLYKVDREALQ